jgi:YVTN family beta-propeller protein
VILDLQSNTVSGNINIRRTSEAMALTGEKAYVAYWSSGKEIMVIDTKTNKVLDSLEVAPEPESMAVDKNNKLWVLCPGSYDRQNFAELIIINTSTDKIEKRYVFPSKEMVPSCLQINVTRDTIYYIEGGIYRMSIASTSLPTQFFIPASGHLFYKLGIDPYSKNIFITDAVDYQQKGFVLRYSSAGKLIDSCRADLIPGAFCFK